MLALRRTIQTVVMAAVSLAATLAPSATAQNPAPVPPGVLEGLVVVPSNTPTTPPTPVAEATVEVFPAVAPVPNPPPVRRGLTDAHGRFRFEGLAAGSYIVRAFKEGVGAGHAMAQLTPMAGARVVITLMPPPPPPPGPPPGVLEGMVVLGSNTPTPIPPTPVADAIVRVFPAVSPVPNPDPIRVGRSDENGRFRFENLRPGTYIVTAHKEGVGHGRTQATLTERHGARVVVVIIPPPPPAGVLQGVVFAATPAGPQPVPGATVLVFEIPATTPNPTPIREGITGKNGTFEFDEMKPGRYRVLAFKEGVGRGSAYALLTEHFGARVRILLSQR